MKGRTVACALSLIVLSACNYTSSSNPAGSTTGKTAATIANLSATTVTDAPASEPVTDSSTTTQAAATTSADFAKPITVAQVASNAEAVASQAEADAAAMDTATP
jgi:hypothetical protein